MLCSLMTVACDSDVYNDDVIWDIVPVTLAMDIQDASGKSLLVPGVPESVVDSDITLTYKDKEYPADWRFREHDGYYSSRAYNAVFSGISYRPVFVRDGNGNVVDSGRRVLVIGEWDGAKNFDETFTLTISENQTETFRIVHTFEMANNKIKDYTTTVWHNGNVVGESVVIVKK